MGREPGKCENGWRRWSGNARARKLIVISNTNSNMIALIWKVHSPGLRLANGGLWLQIYHSWLCSCNFFRLLLYLGCRIQSGIGKFPDCCVVRNTLLIWTGKGWFSGWSVRGFLKTLDWNSFQTSSLPIVELSFKRILRGINGSCVHIWGTDEIQIIDASSLQIAYRIDYVICTFKTYCSHR